MSDSDHPPYVIGIDAGGTKTEAVLADAEGRILARARRGGANLTAHGELTVEKTLHELIEATLDECDVRVSAICLGIAGSDREEDAPVIRGIMRRIGSRARIVVTNDALIALVAGVGAAPGVVVIAGTGSIAYGVNQRNEAARAGGWGYILADEGSGYWLGRQALRAVVRAADGRGPATALTPLILEVFKVSRPQALVREVYRHYLKPGDIARCASTIQQASDAGDEVAAAIAAHAADELTSSAASVIRQLSLAEASFDVVLAGGAFLAVPHLQTALMTRLPGVAPGCRVSLLQKDPALGAVQLALNEARGGATLPVYRVS